MEQKNTKEKRLRICMNQMLQSVALLVGGIMIGYLMLMIVYLLPVEKMQKNLLKSIDVLAGEQEYHRVVPGYNSTQLDNYTDSWMIGNAVYNNVLPIWERALTCTSADYGDGPLNGLVHYLKEPGGGIKRQNILDIGMATL